MLFFFLNFCCIKYLGQSFYIELKKFKESRKVFKSICKKISVKMIFIKIVFLLVSRALKTGISKSFQILAYTFVFIFALILFNFIIQLPTISLVERFYIYLLNKNIQTTYGKYFLWEKFVFEKIIDWMICVLWFIKKGNIFRL